jgi:hypothetical protein
MGGIDICPLCTKKAVEAFYKKKANDRVINMAEKMQDSRLWTPEQVLDDVKKEIASGEIKAKMLMVIYLDEDDDHYSPGFTQAGMRVSQIVSLCEAVKTLALQQMGLIADPLDRE